VFATQREEQTKREGREVAIAAVDIAAVFASQSEDKLRENAGR
jgi:hypothetical protein